VIDSGVEIQKDYTPAQEGTYFGAEDATDFASRITANENSISTIWQIIYPIGTIYETASSTFNPATAWGGTWTRIKGKVIVGVDEADADFNVAGKTGGVKRVSLTIAEMPSNVWNSYSNFSGGVKTFINPGSNYGLNTLNNEMGQSHNNLQPYETAYIWKRIA